MRQVLRVVIGSVIAALAMAAPGCDGSADRSLVVIVEASLHAPLKASFDQYAETMREARYEVQVVPWVPGDVHELKDLIYEYVDDFGVEGALLIGDLPAAWYRIDVPPGWIGQLGFEGPVEHFPTDLFLQDRDARWVDGDGALWQDPTGAMRKTYDYHEPLHLDIYTARLLGTEEELRDYFARLEHYRHVGPLVKPSGYIFLDDDWANKDTSDLLGLDELYGDIEVVQDVAVSCLDEYLDRLDNGGAEFVYQLIHAHHYWLGFDHVDSEGYCQEKLFQSVIRVSSQKGLKVSFLNMANCYGARFVGVEETSLAEAFTVGTEYGLAVLGSTKAGAQLDPRLFHQSLASGMRWGPAYRRWYNALGHRNDLWHMGIVIVGDPLLRVTGDLFPAGPSEEVTWGEE